jgi:hypothetical protein
MVDIKKTVNEYKTVLILLLVGIGIIIVAFFLSMIKWMLLLAGFIMIGTGGYLVYKKIKESKVVQQIKKFDLTKQ